MNGTQPRDAGTQIDPNQKPLRVRPPPFDGLPISLPAPLPRYSSASLPALFHISSLPPSQTPTDQQATWPAPALQQLVAPFDACVNAWEPVQVQTGELSCQTLAPPSSPQASKCPGATQAASQRHKSGAPGTDPACRAPRAAFQCSCGGAAWLWVSVGGGRRGPRGRCFLQPRRSAAANYTHPKAQGGDAGTQHAFRAPKKAFQCSCAGATWLWVSVRRVSAGRWWARRDDDLRRRARRTKGEDLGRYR